MATRWNKFSNKFKKEPNTKEYESIVKNIFGPLVPHWPEFDYERNFSLNKQ